MKIGIINNKIGNIGSVYSALQFYNYDILVINAPTELAKVDITILAGVGNFKAGAQTLRKLHFWEPLQKYVVEKKKPLIGLCLGMQLFADVSYENGESTGFGWIPGKVVRLDGKKARIPHIGWNRVDGNDRLVFKNLLYNNFYFMHSYHLIPHDKSLIIGTTQCGNETIVSGIKKKNIIGFQFHPEKSQGDGLRILKNAIETLTC